MVLISDKDWETLCEVEELLHNKLVITNAIVDKKNGGYYFDENDDEYNTWCKFNTFVEKIAQYKDFCKKWNEVNNMNGYDEEESDL